ncbi:MAG: glycosyltransferase family 39 protein [Cyanobacteria bacterium P01_A01_bin.123]
MTVTKRSARFPVELILFSAIALAVLLRVVMLGSREFWYDEVLSLLFATGQRIFYKPPEDVPMTLANYTPLLSLPMESGLKDILLTTKGLLKGIVSMEPHPFGFYLSQNLWLRLTSNGEASQRTLGMLFSLGTIGCSYGTGKLLLGHRGGLIYAALLGLSPLYLFHSLNLRMYGPTVFWVCLSTLALLQLIYGGADRKLWKTSAWTAVLIGAIAGGFLTFYPMLYWIAGLAITAVVLDLKHWWRHGLRFTAGVLITVPWMLWGLPQQLRNADFGRFSAPPGFFATALTHIQGVLKTLGIHLLVGDWATSMSDPALWIVGIIAGLIWVAMGVALLQQGEDRLLKIGLLLGLLPLALAFTSDVASSKFTFGFGYGRSVIFGLPGMMLILAIWLERTKVGWRNLAIAGSLAFYLTLNVSDFTLRDRQIFHQLNGWVNQAPDQPTLIVLNSKAWGHIMRLAYYINSEATVDLLATHPADLPNALSETLTAGSNAYDRVLWLEAASPVWQEPETDAQTAEIRQQVEGILGERYQPQKTQSLVGTMDLDQFTLKQYSES